jgi:hypothetical protein
VQRRLGQQVGRHRRGDEQEQRDQQLVHLPVALRPVRGQAAQQHATDAQRGGLGRRVQPHVEILEAQQAHAADQREQAADRQQQRDQCLPGPVQLLQVHGHAYSMTSPRTR